MPTIHDVARSCGVSARTVSRVINGQDHVRPELRKRVQEMTLQMGYRPDPSARALKSGRKRLIGIVVNAVSSDTTFKRIERISRLCGDADYGVLVRFADGGETEDAAVDSVVPWCDGLVVFSNMRTLRSPALDRLSAEDFPFILVDPPRRGPYPSVLVDRRGGYREAVLFLAGRGRRKPVLLIEEFRADERIAGFQEGLAAASLAFSPGMIRRTGKEYAGGQEAAGELLQMFQRGEADAVLCHNDKMALGLMSGLAPRRIRIPGDLSVVGFDGDGFTPFVRPAITTIAPEGGDGSDFIFEQLKNRIEGAGTKKSRIIKTGLVVRDSA